MVGGYLYFTRNVTENADGTKTTTYKKFSSFGTGGKNENETTPENNEVKDPQNQVSLSVDSKFRKITEVPVAGASFYKTIIKTEIEQPVATPTTETKTTDNKKITQTKNKGKEIVLPEVVVEQNLPKEEFIRTVRYVERTTGHIYQYNLDSKQATRASNTTVPNIYEAFFNDTGDKALYRYSSDNKNISTYQVTTGKELGDFLPSNIVNISSSPKKDKFFYLIKNENGVVGHIKNFFEVKSKVVFESSFSEWISQYINDNTIYITTKASADKQGYLYSINTKTGTLNKLYGNQLGFTTLANSRGDYVLISTVTNGNLNLEVLDVLNYKTLPLGLSTLPEKCVWGSNNIDIYCAVPKEIPQGSYPDDWYKGVVSFNDRFVKINTSNSEIIPISADDSQNIDATSLFISDDQDTLFFINKKDSTLWSLDMK